VRCTYHASAAAGSAAAAVFTCTEAVSAGTSGRQFHCQRIPQPLSLAVPSPVDIPTAAAIAATAAMYVVNADNAITDEAWGKSSIYTWFQCGHSMAGNWKQRPNWNPSKWQPGPAALFQVGSRVRARLGAGWSNGVVSGVNSYKGKFTGVYRVIFNVGTWANMRGPEERQCQANDVSARDPLAVGMEVNPNSQASDTSKSTFQFALTFSKFSGGTSGLPSVADMLTRQGMYYVVCYSVLNMCIILHQDQTLCEFHHKEMLCSSCSCSSRCSWIGCSRCCRLKIQPWPHHRHALRVCLYSRLSRQAQG